VLAQVKRLGGDSLLYALMNVGTKLIAFIMLPIFTRFLTVSEYGVLDFTEKIMAMLTFLVLFGTDSALSFYYFESKDDKQKLKYVTNTLIFRVFVVVLVFLIVLIFGKPLSNLLYDSDNYVNLLYLGTLLLLVDTVTTLVLSVLRFEFKTVKVVIYTFLKMLLFAVFSYAALIVLQKDPESIYTGRIIGSIIMLILTIGVTYQYSKGKYDVSVMKELLRYGAPLVPASLSFWLIANLNTFFLKEYQSFEEVGIFGASMKIAALITLVTSGIQMAWRPYSMSIKDKEDSPVLFAKIFIALLVIGSVGLLGIATIMPWLIGILGKEYAEAYKYVALISCASFLNFYYLIISVGLFFKKKTAYISYAIGIAAVVSVILNVIFIPSLSIWGVVISYLSSMVLVNVLIFIRSQKVYYVPVSVFKLLWIFGNLVLVILSIIYIQENGLPYLWLIASWLYFIICLSVIRIDKVLLSK
jgi:O-antigen/teichoic acid export membrane protein